MIRLFEFCIDAAGRVMVRPSLWYQARSDRERARLLREARVWLDRELAEAEAVVIDG